MFSDTPQITNLSCQYINNQFYFSFELTGGQSDGTNKFSDFGLLILPSEKTIQNYVPNYKLVQKDNSFLLSDSSQATIANSVVKCLQIYKTSYKQQNVVVYITPFQYNKNYESTDYKDLTYSFSNTIQLVIKTDDLLNKNTVLDYTIIETLSQLDFDSLSLNDNTSQAISDIYTSFIDDKKIKNYLFINNQLLSQRQQDKITNIINYKSSIINKLIIPSILIRNNRDYVATQTQMFNTFDCVTFEDLYETNLNYTVTINYNISSIVDIITGLILSYRQSKDKTIEISILNLLNIDESLISNYLSFLKGYSITYNKTEYDFVSLFNRLYDYVTITDSSKNNRKPAYENTFKISLPFQDKKYIEFSKYTTNNNIIVAIPSKVIYTNSTAMLKTNSDIYNTLFINKTNSDSFNFVSSLNTKSISIVKKQKQKKSLIKTNMNNLIEDYKITNQKVTINDVFTKYPTDVATPVVLTKQQEAISNEIYRKITHKLFGSIDEYQKTDNMSLNYYLQIASFDSKNLKQLQWNDLTLDALKSLQTNELIFIRLLPDFSDTKMKTNIFNFSYNMNQLVKVSELLSYVS